MSFWEDMKVQMLDLEFVVVSNIPWMRFFGDAYGNS